MAHLENQFPLYDSSDWATEQSVKKQCNSGGGSNSGDVSIPLNLICIWPGSIDTIPSGWALCDGQNGRPDLRDVFVLGAGTKYTPGSTGGEESVTLTVDQMPAHSHSYRDTTGGSSLYQSKKEGDGANYLTYAIKTSSSNGDSKAHNNMPPYHALHYIIYVGV